MHNVLLLLLKEEIMLVLYNSKYCLIRRNNCFTLSKLQPLNLFQEASLMGPKFF
jgi:hypothetical protein